MTERRAIALDAVRADGWFERLGQGSRDFEQLCHTVGERFVAFAFISGVRIRGLTIDRRSPDATLVDFVFGEEAVEQRLALGEFRRRLAQALLSDDPMPVDMVPADESVETLQNFIGLRYVLLAPLFGIVLKTLDVGGRDEPTLVVELEGSTQETHLEDFREAIRERIRMEVRRMRSSSPFSIDFSVLPHAERALMRGDFAATIELLGAWPGPLSMLLRTPEGQSLAPDVRSTLARALGLLGTAYVRAMRFDWAEEVMRLAIQWGQDANVSGELFLRLGDAYVARGRFGEAIGLLRRAATLGAPDDDVLPLLAKAFTARKRYVAAAICAERAIARGSQVADMEAVLDEARAVLGGPYARVRREVAARWPDSDAVSLEMLRATLHEDDTSIDDSSESEHKTPASEERDAREGEDSTVEEPEH